MELEWSTNNESERRKSDTARKYTRTADRQKLGQTGLLFIAEFNFILNNSGRFTFYSRIQLYFE